jgi:hypothetical protein
MSRQVARSIFAVALSCLILLAPIASPPTVANAAGTCRDPIDNYFDGFYQADGRTNAYEGVSSYIYVQQTYLCSGSTVEAFNFSNAWVMIAGDYAGDNDAYGQVGFELTYGKPMRWFSQFHDGYGRYTTRYSSFSIANEYGNRHIFRVLWSGTCSCLRAIIDTTEWATSPFNPFRSAEADFGPQPWSPQFLGETGFLQSNMPGSPSRHTRYAGMGAQRFSDDQLESMPCILSGTNDNPGAWGLDALGCTSFDIWTK